MKKAILFAATLLLGVFMVSTTRAAFESLSCDRWVCDGCGATTERSENPAFPKKWAKVAVVSNIEVKWDFPISDKPYRITVRKTTDASTETLHFCGTCLHSPAQQRKFGARLMQNGGIWK